MLQQKDRESLKIAIKNFRLKSLKKKKSKIVSYFFSTSAIYGNINWIDNPRRNKKEIKTGSSTYLKSIQIKETKDRLAKNRVRVSFGKLSSTFSTS